MIQNHKSKTCYCLFYGVRLTAGPLFSLTKSCHLAFYFLLFAFCFLLLLSLLFFAFRFFTFAVRFFFCFSLFAFCDSRFRLPPLDSPHFCRRACFSGFVPFRVPVSPSFLRTEFRFHRGHRQGRYFVYIILSSETAQPVFLCAVKRFLLSARCLPLSQAHSLLRSTSAPSSSRRA